MAQSSIPWQGQDIGDAGPYSASEWQNVWKRSVAASGHRANAGYLLGSGDPGSYGLRVLQSSPAGASIRVFAGSGMVQGIFYHSSAVETIPIAANSSGNPRIDLVVLQADYTTQEVRLVLKQGTPAASPVRPTIVQSAGVLWEVPLADVAVANGFLTITASDVTFIGEPANGAHAVIIDDILNNSGGELKTGDVVLWDSGTNLSVGTSADNVGIAGRVAGVWQGLNAAGTRGKVLVRGLSFVRVNGAVAVYDPISMHSVAKEGVSGQRAVFARALQSQATTGYLQCYVDAGHEMMKTTLIAQVNISPAQSMPNAGALNQVTNWQHGSILSSPALHDNSTNPARLHMPRVGLWLFDVYVDIANTDGTYREAGLYDSALGPISDENMMPIGGSGKRAIVHFNAMHFNTTAADYALVYVAHDAPAARNLQVASYVKWMFMGDIIP